MTSRKVITVKRAEAATFPTVIDCGQGTARLAAAAAWQDVQAKTPAELTISSKTEDRSRQWTAKLEMTVCAKTYDCRTRYAYLLTLADGTRLLMGSGQRPHPVAETSLELADSTSKSQMLAVTVTHTDTRPPLIITE